MSRYLHRTPEHYLPSSTDLLWLIAESPRKTVLFDVDAGILMGRATAVELAHLIWPGINIYEKRRILSNQSAIKWLTDRLDYEVLPCAQGGAGRLEKEGSDYLKSSIFIEGAKRPDDLLRWPVS